jgi:hypothetical protein
LGVEISEKILTFHNPQEGEHLGHQHSLVKVQVNQFTTCFCTASRLEIAGNICFSDGALEPGTGLVKGGCGFERACAHVHIGWKIII